MESTEDRLLERIEFYRDGCALEQIRLNKEGLNTFTSLGDVQTRVTLLAIK
jgi:hypothetical protein